jgi:enterochelin esterase-like enzyme
VQQSVPRRARRVLTASVLLALVVLVAAGAALEQVRTAAGAAPPGASSPSSFSPSPSVSAPVTPSALAAHGVVRKAVFPATVSHFVARPGYVYLPPAALLPHAPALPVVIALSGQSRNAQPLDVVGRNRVPAIMDRIAAAHHGRAPIVVVPDQLGAGPRNPMCVDSPLGNVATYITVDVRSWVLTHLHVARDPRDWTIAGFSQGGTCAIQFGAAHPELFGSIVDISGEEAPKNGSIAHTVAVGFGGSAAAYRRATPLALLQAHAPYADSVALFTVGGADKHYLPVAPRLARAATAAGMQAAVKIFPGLKHNWTVATDGFAWAFERLVGRWHL